MSPGITGSGSGRPKIMPQIEFTSCLLNKKYGKIGIKVGDKKNHFLTFETNFDEIKIENYKNESKENIKFNKFNELNFGTIKVPLISLCLARSGDKGDSSNIGII
jgi:hypothetical protein